MTDTTLQDLINSFQVRFLSGKAEGKNFTMQFDITGEGGNPFTVMVKDGTLFVTESLIGDPDCILTASVEDYIAIETGAQNPMMAILSGKVKVSNALKLPEFTGLFRGYVSVKNDGLC
ncbi:SCP2 sterol-binding domain-containing protein [Algivirga pacifica]|uniref:SCP2 domain-containing protein n=1 Tax=Algivirga pacifica TaxID=1162670 RepID=A0ABP9CWJ4_9BACT